MAIQLAPPTKPSTFSVPTIGGPSINVPALASMPGAAERPESCEFRSDALGYAAARTTNLAKECVNFLLEVPGRLPVGSTTAPDAKSTVCIIEALMNELLSSSMVNEPNQAHNTLPCQQVSAGLSRLVKNLHSIHESFGVLHSRRVLLRPLIPIYLSAGQGKLGTGLSDTLSLFRSTIAVAELNRLLESSDLTEWFLTKSSQEDPFPHLENTFNISTNRLAKRFWHSTFQSRNEGVAISKRAIEALAIDTSKDKRAAGWWSLACQISDQNQKIRVPAEVAVGLVDWNRLLDHWHRLELALAGGLPLSGRDGLTQKDSQPTAETSVKSKVTKLDDRRFVEIRSVNDPELSSNLEKMLSQARSNQSELSFLVVKCLESQQPNSPSAIQGWQSKFIHCIDEFGLAANARGFVSDEGDLSLVYEDVERSEVARWIRESFSKLQETDPEAKLAVASAIPLVAGVASVIAPSRSFKIDQLIQSAVRCLDGATKQGAGAIKTIEVY